MITCYYLYKNKIIESQTLVWKIYKELWRRGQQKGYIVTSGNHKKCGCLLPDNHFILHTGKSLLIEEATWWMTQDMADEVELVFPNTSWAPGLTCSWDLTFLTSLSHAWPCPASPTDGKQGLNHQKLQLNRDGQREGVGYRGKGVRKRKKSVHRLNNQKELGKVLMMFHLQWAFTNEIFKVACLWMSFCLLATQNGEGLCLRGIRPGVPVGPGPVPAPSPSTATGGQPPVSGSTGHQSPRELTPWNEPLQQLDKALEWRPWDRR